MALNQRFLIKTFRWPLMILTMILIWIWTKKLNRMQGMIKEKGDRMELAVLGMIKIGMKNDKGYPVSLDHFLCKSDIKKYEQKFQEVMGEKPNVIEICFASDDPK